MCINRTHAPSFGDHRAKGNYSGLQLQMYGIHSLYHCWSKCCTALCNQYSWHVQYLGNPKSGCSRFPRSTVSSTMRVAVGDLLIWDRAETNIMLQPCTCTYKALQATSHLLCCHFLAQDVPWHIDWFLQPCAKTC